MTDTNEKNQEILEESKNQVVVEGESSAQPRTSNQRVLGFLINFLLVIIVGIMILLVWNRIQSRNRTSLGVAPTGTTEVDEVIPTEVPEQAGGAKVNLSPYVTTEPFGGEGGVSRNVQIHTTIPTRPRVDVITYTVEVGDSLFSIAELFGLKPETILWGNYDVLQDNPHLLKPDQVLNILPLDGTYYEWSEDDTLSQVASFFEVEPEAILEYPGNRFDLTTASVDDPDIEPGTALIVPGGQREVQDWGPPQISRNNPASAAYYGPGHCGSVYTGAVGDGFFMWPTTATYISGYNYDPVVHPAIDIGGDTGNAIYAADAGVVVYAGWSNWGYGYLIVLDHGGGWQTAYAHLSSVGVGCGASVFRGTVIGGLGSTGNSTGPHLHFEMVYNGAKLNPLNFISP